MDVHLWAKLGTDGKIQSVQSSCAQASFDDGTTFPVIPDRDHHLVDERFVPYMEKKKLVCTLGAKVEEMSIMIRQLADLSEKDKLQRKLIQQYEKQIANLQKQVQKLEIENLKLKSQAVILPGQKSDKDDLKTLVKVPKHRDVCRAEGVCSRSLSWPECLNDKHLRNLEDSKACSIDSKQDIDKLKETEMQDLTENMNQHINDTVPQAFKVDLDISSLHSHVNLDVEGQVNVSKANDAGKNAYSYVTEHVQLKLLEDNGLAKVSDEANETVSGDVPEKRKRKDVIFQLDDNGYLQMDALGQLLPADEILYRSKSLTSPPFAKDFELDETKSSPSDEIKGENTNFSQLEMENFIKECLQNAQQSPKPKVCRNPSGYEDIPDVDDVIEPVKPPLPPRRKSGLEIKPLMDPSCSEKQSPTREHKYLGNPNCSKNQGLPESRPSTLSLQTVHSADDLAQHRSDFRRGKSSSFSSVSSASSSCSSPSHERRVRSESVHSGDNRKDDALNRLFKDMRTTMEWDKTKKKLMHMSHMNTVDHIEKQLRAVVKEVFYTYDRMGSDRHHSQTATKKRVMERVKNTLAKENSQSKEIVTDDFLLKCIDLLIITSPVQSP